MVIWLRVVFSAIWRSAHTPEYLRITVSPKATPVRQRAEFRDGEIRSHAGKMEVVYTSIGLQVRRVFWPLSPGLRRQVLPMLALLHALQFEKQGGRSALVLWLCPPFDEHYSFRAALAELEQALGNVSDRATHELPEEYPLEDFVDGLFRWGDRNFALYYERSLGYLQFSSESVGDVKALRAALSSITRVAEDDSPALPAIPHQQQPSGNRRKAGFVVASIVVAAWGIVASHDLWINAAADAGGYMLALLLIVPPTLVALWSLFLIMYAAPFALGVFVFRVFDRITNVGACS